MKILLVDVGNFYTKTVVLSRASEKDRGDRAEPPYQFYGRCFFPTRVSRAADMEKDRMYYEHQGERYAVGYDCNRRQGLDRSPQTFDGRGLSTDQALLILKKIIFDYADNQDEIIIYTVVDSPSKARVFEETGEMLDNKKVDISGFRGYDKRRIRKEVTVRLVLMSSGEAITGFLKKKKTDFKTALVVDVGYKQTKLYVVDGGKGVELFQIGNCGVSFYYEKIVHLFSEEPIDDNHFLWLVKQIELGCEEVEVRWERGVGKPARDAAGLNPVPGNYDISLVLENVRWDLNKEFKRVTTDILTSYYTNRVEWPDLLVVMGGGASLNGELLRLSLEDGGYCFDEVCIEKHSLYTVLDGAGYVLRALQAECLSI